MSFAIEVPADANPFNLQELCRVLGAGNSSDHAQRQTATQQLSTWESQSGFYSGLQTIFLDTSLPHELRLLAVIYFKNGIDKHWRLISHVKYGISAEEKAIIRSRLYQGTIDETSTPLLVQSSLAIAKIVRIDQSKEWPEAIPTLIQIIRNIRSSGAGSAIKLYSALNILLRIVKELATARLRKIQTSLQELSPEIVYLCCEIYSENKNAWCKFMQDGQGNAAVMETVMSNSLISLRILRRLVVFGYEDPWTDNSVREFWAISQVNFGELMGFIDANSHIPAEYQEVVGKHLMQFAKLHLGIADTHPTSFVKLPASIPLVQSYWQLVSKFAVVFGQYDGIRQTGGQSSKAKVEGPLDERLALKGLLLLRTCTRIAFQPVQTFRFRSEEVKAEQHKAMEIIKEQLITPPFVLEIVNTLISHLFIFRKSDHEAWEEDPEGWESREQSEGNAYEWEVRPCAEKLFLDLLLRFKDILIPPLLQYFQSAMSPTATIENKESVYTALGIAAQYLKDVFNFDEFVTVTLVNDSQIQESSARILRRRIAILLRQIIPLNIAAETKPVMYQMFRNFMNPNDPLNDAVVRLTAGRELRFLLDDLDFQADNFLQVTPDILGALVNLTTTAEVDETKLAILETIRLLVTRMESHVSQFGDYIMTVLPEVWMSAGSDEYMVKQSVIAIFSALVMSMGPDSQKYHEVIIPLIAETARQESDLHSHLIDEVLELWNSVLQQSSAPLTPSLIALLDSALPLIEYESETATGALTAVESYLVFAPDAVLEERFRKPTLVALSKSMDNRNREQARMSVECMELLIMRASEMGGTDGIQVVLQDMVETKVMHKILESLHDAWSARQSTGPNAKVSRLSGMEESDYFSVLARLLYAEPNLFVSMMTSFGRLEEVWNWLVGEWFAVRDAMDRPDKMKIYTLALTRLMELQQPVQNLVLSKLQDYFTLWNEIIAELNDGLVVPTDCLVWPDYEVNEWDTPKLIRQKELALRDPVHHVPIRDYIRSHLQMLMQNVGGESVFQSEYAVNVDNDVLQKYSALMSMAP
ncbi:hypothetical protein TD95_000039 [Thielaviopsis punctulata]|uniref:Importin N-terminal domain-containing protein n=1 Tax=Thielaviopsis punctulata TaxID=72032 RepID=A0A0F4Z6U3_9PEZI|nr:hypothetical protein TD95_000039 [Thielaviopsis punctulata]